MRTSGSPQSATVATSFAAPLVVTVRDAASRRAVRHRRDVHRAGHRRLEHADPDDRHHRCVGPGLAGGRRQRTIAGAYSVVASVPGVTPSASFALTNVAGAGTTISIVSGDAQSTVVNAAFAAPFVAALSDAFGNPVAGATLAFAAPATAPSATLSTPAVTNATGQTSVTGTARTKTGSFPITVSASGATSATFTTVEAATAGPPATVALTGGNNQTPTVNTVFGAPLIAVTVLDSFGNPVPGVTVAFAGPTTGARASFPAAATTNASGVGQVTPTAGTIAGPYAITATVSGLPAVTFSATNVAGTAAAVTAHSGSGQSTRVTTAFTNPLVALVTDAFGNPVSGASVTFTAAPRGGAMPR